MNSAGTVKIDTGTFRQVECEDKSAGCNFYHCKVLSLTKTLRLTSKSLKEANKVFEDVQQDLRENALNLHM